MAAATMFRSGRAMEYGCCSHVLFRVGLEKNIWPLTAPPTGALTFGTPQFPICPFTCPIKWNPILKHRALCVALAEKHREEKKQTRKTFGNPQFPMCSPSGT